MEKDIEMFIKNGQLNLLYNQFLELLKLYNNNQEIIIKIISKFIQEEKILFPFKKYI